MIRSGSVLVGGAIATNPARQVATEEPIVLRSEEPFVSRGGYKLAGALEQFDVDVTGRLALDVGSSTGGFTDCLLQHSVGHVVAVDVGTNQFHEKLRGDPRVTVREQTDIRDLTHAVLSERFEVVAVDVSFIALSSVLPTLVDVTVPGADLILLVKPQFEATRLEADRVRGVIRDPQVWRRVLMNVQNTLLTLRAGMMGCMVSPLRGRQGNVEFLMHAKTWADNGRTNDMYSKTRIAEMVDAAVASAVES